MRKNLILFYFLITAAFCFGQQPQLLQERSYFISGQEKQLFTSAATGNGDVFYSGNILTGAYQYTNYFLRVKSNTDTVWTKTSPANLRQYFQALQPTKPEGVIFAGTQKHQLTTSSGILLQKLDGSGNTTWSKSFFSSSGYDNSPSSLLVLPDKGFLIGGQINFKGFSLVRTDSLGNQMWVKNFTRTNRDVINDIKFTNQSNIICAGITSVNGPNTWNLKLLLLNQKGDSLRGKTLNVTGPNRIEGMDINYNSIMPLSDGGFLLTADTDTITPNYPNGSNLGLVVKLDSMFNVQWKYVHRTQNTDEYIFTKAKELSDGSILVLGFQFRPTQGGNGFQLYRFGLNGQLINVYPFTSSICSQTWGLTLDHLPDSTYLVGGRCGNNPPITYGFYVAKVKIPGLPLPVAPFTITGTKEELATNGAGLGQSYPNPTAASAIIPFTLPQRYTKASILIREIATGREIKRYDLKRNSSSLNVDLGHLSNGLYLYSLVVDEQPVATKKLAVMK